MTEPTETKVKVHLIYVFKTTVKKVEEVWETVSGEIEKDKTVLTKRFRGWFVLFDGSRESIYFEVDKPSFVVGDKVRITFSHAD